MARSNRLMANSETNLLNGEIFETLLEAKVLIERWREDYNTVRPHSSLNYRPPAPEAWLLDTETNVIRKRQLANRTKCRTSQCDEVQSHQLQLNYSLLRDVAQELGLY